MSLLLALLVTACGGGGGGSNGGDRAVAQSGASSAPAAEVVTLNRTITTPMNVPLLFDKPSSSEDPSTQGSWYLPSRGSIAFLRRQGAAIYLPPLGFQGSEEFRYESEFPDGRIERTIFTAQIESAEPLVRPSACRSSVLADERIVRLSAHPGISKQLVALRRNGLALEALRSEDGGASWTAGDSIPASEMDVLEFDAASDGLVQAATASSNWQSVDGGLSWQSVPSPTWETGSEPLYYLEGSRILRRADAASEPHVIYSSAVELIRLAADPRNPRRVYLLSADGLYTLFPDGLPGVDPAVEGVIVAPVETGFEEPLLDMTVDASGRILIAGESRIYCVEGDRPFRDPIEGSPPDMEFVQIDGEARLQLSLPEISEPTELTLWLQATRFVTAQPGIIADAPAVLRVMTLQTGDERNLELLLGVEELGVYTVAAVLRTAAGIVAQNSETTLIEPLSDLTARVDLSVQAETVPEPNGSAAVQVRVGNAGPYAAEGVELRLAASGQGRIQSPVISEPGNCSADTDAMHCRLSGPLAAGAEALITFISRERAGAATTLHLSVTSEGNEANQEDNVWSSASSLVSSQLSISAEALRTQPLRGTEALFRLAVTNDGPTSVQPYVEGYLERHQGDPVVDYGDWVVVADDGDCVMPAQFCGPGACPEARSHRQHYRCEFREPLLPAEVREVTISMKASVEGERIRSVALVTGGYELTSRDNLSVAEVGLTNEVEPTTPNPPPSGPSCAGLLILLTWGACLGW